MVLECLPDKNIPGQIYRVWQEIIYLSGFKLPQPLEILRYPTFYFSFETSF